jgi:hypothetical protein
MCPFEHRTSQLRCLKLPRTIDGFVGPVALQREGQTGALVVQAWWSVEVQHGFAGGSVPCPPDDPHPTVSREFDSNGSSDDHNNGRERH